MTIEITGKVFGTRFTHDADSLEATFANAYAVHPDGFEGLLKDAPADASKRPLILFMHGSSGIGEPLKEFARRTAELGWAFIAPDSMQLEDRMTYSSPVARSDYEKIHAMRSFELEHAVRKITGLGFFNGVFVAAGTSEGGVCAARHQTKPGSPKPVGRIIFSWSCENNYHVEEHRTNIPKDEAVLNIMSAQDKFFSRANAFLDNPNALGHAAEALSEHPDAQIVLIPGAPHTLFNTPQAAMIVKAFLARFAS